LILALLALGGCAPPPAPPSARALPAGLAVEAPGGASRVTVRDPGGAALLTRRLPQPLESLELALAWPAGGTYAVEVVGPEGAEVLEVVVPEARPLFTLSLEAPVGQGSQPVSDGQAVSVLLVDGQPVQAAVILTALDDGPASLSLGDVERSSDWLRAGERLTVLADLAGPAAVRAALGEQRAALSLETREVPLEDIQRQLTIADVHFPARAGGEPDPSRPEGRVTLPPGWWQEVLRRTPLGWRPRDQTLPWAWWGVRLRNDGAEAVNVVLRAKVLDADGATAEAFRPRMREGDAGTGEVRALLRVPPGEAVGALPLFVDEALLGAADAAEGRWTVAIDALPLGGRAPLASWEAPLYVSRVGAAASAGLVLGAAAALAGAALLLARGRRWLAESATSELMTVAMFGALTFVVGAAGRVLSLGVAAALGPFSSLVTALVDDAFRYALLATLVTLLPRPGVAALMQVTAWLLTGIALGGFGPTELIFLASGVLWLEGGLWLTGVTRSGRWREQPGWARWLRLSAAFSSASLLSGATGIVVAMALYRLYYADWFVALLLGGPGFLYVLAACAVAVPFADSLRRVQR
jgi:hypothetical protein